MHLGRPHFHARPVSGLYEYLVQRKAVARIGKQEFPLEIGIGSEHMYLHNLPKLGISPELIAALKGGGTLVLEGKAVQRLPEAQRSFPLDGGAKLIEDVERGCGR